MALSWRYFPAFRDLCILLEGCHVHLGFFWCSAQSHPPREGVGLRSSLNSLPTKRCPCRAPFTRRDTIFFSFCSICFIFENFNAYQSTNNCIMNPQVPIWVSFSNSYKGALFVCVLVRNRWHPQRGNKESLQGETTYEGENRETNAGWQRTPRLAIAGGPEGKEGSPVMHRNWNPS